MARDPELTSEGSAGVENPFDRVTALAAALFKAPIAAVSMVEGDCYVLSSARGTTLAHGTSEDSVSQHTMALGPHAVLVIEDMRKDPRTRDNPYVQGAPHGRFYAGAVITTADGRIRGAVAVADTEPRERPSEDTLDSLRMLARIAGDIRDRLDIERRQRESLETLNLAEAMAGVGHWRLDLVTETVKWSDEVYRIHGVTPQTFDPSYDNAVDFYHPDDRDKVRAWIRDAIATGECGEFKLRLVRADGQERTVISQCRPERDEGGAVIALFGVFQDVTEQVRVHEQVARSEALFRLMSETSTDIMARYKPDGEFLYLSPSVERVLGRTPESLLGRKAADIIHPEDVADTYAQIGACAAAGKDARSLVEYRALHADGSIVWLEASPRAIRDDDGRIVEMHDHVRDITEHKTAQREQTEMVETLKLAESMAGVGQWRWDVLANVVTWSDEVYRIHGVDAATFNPSLNSVLESYHPDDRSTLEAMIDHTLATGEGYEFQFRLIRPDGAERIVESRARGEIDGQGRVHALFGVVQDVTDRERAIERIAESERRYRLLAERGTDIITVCGVDGIFSYVSPAMESTMGYRPDEMVGRDFADFVHPEDIGPMRTAFAEYLAGGPDAPPPRVLWRAFKKSGEVAWLEGHPKVVWNASGRPVEIQDLLRDVTETKRLQAELIEARDRAEKNALAKSEFLANMSHELRTPLTSVIGFSGLLQGSGNLPEAERKYADRIATASEALLSVINDILDYSKLEVEAVDLDPQPFDPRAMAEGATAIIESQCVDKGLTLEVDVAANLPAAMMGDEGRLRQVTLDFLSNAMKFTANGTVRLVVAMAGDRLRVEVTDSGIGIAPDKIDTLFDRFTQADTSTTRLYGGTGLGLAISRRLIEMMGGTIGADSRPGEGSTFWFEVPVREADIDRDTGGVDDQAIRSDLKILMADDAAPNRELVTAILGGLGLALDTVSDGAQAVEAAAAGRYDLILMDVHMPVMDGLDATRTIRAMAGAVGQTPIIALTANVQPEQVLRCRDAGMDGHVGKPIQLSELLAVLAAASARTLEQTSEGERQRSVGT